MSGIFAVGWFLCALEELEVLEVLVVLEELEVLVVLVVLEALEALEELLLWPARSGESVPRRSLGKLELFNSLIVDFRPLLPPSEPFTRKRILPKSRSKSSQMTRISSG